MLTLLARPSLLRTAAARMPRLAVRAKSRPLVPALGFTRSSLICEPRVMRAFATAPQPPTPHKHDAVSHIQNPQTSEKRMKDGPECQTQKLPRMGILQRLKALMRQYGWWALGMYLVLGGLDCAIRFAVIHFYFGEQIHELEAWLGEWLGPLFKKNKDKEPKEDGITAWIRQYLPSEPDKATEMEQFIARISTEFVLAYAIHKTLLLPLRAGITIAITPAFVRWLVRRGWARPVKNTASAASKQF